MLLWFALIFLKFLCEPLQFHVVSKHRNLGETFTWATISENLWGFVDEVVRALLVNIYQSSFWFHQEQKFHGNHKIHLDIYLCIRRDIFPLKITLLGSKQFLNLEISDNYDLVSESQFSTFSSLLRYFFKSHNILSLKC